MHLPVSSENVTDEYGRVDFKGLPIDSFEVKTWHPLQEDALDATNIITSDKALSLDIALSMVNAFDDSESEYAY